MKFIHLSPTTDFSSELQSQLKIINSNILYCTHELDKLHKILTNWRTEQQTMDYYGKKYGEDLGQTSPQTNSEERKFEEANED